MPKKKATKVTSKKKVEKKPVAEEIFPLYDGSRVRKVMEDGHSNATHLHCKMEDGTTKHVPRELFN